MASSSTKSAINPFNQHWAFFKDNYLPSYYEQDIVYQQEQITFRSLSPKIDQEEKKDGYFDDDNDDSDALYEATLLNSNFLSSIEEQKPIGVVNSSSLDRLRQILDHIKPTPSCYSSAHTNMTLPDINDLPSIRSQFSSSSSSSHHLSAYQHSTTTTTTTTMRDFPFSSDPKGKGKFKPTL
ncbi:uncharacterized protein BX663DRAFT_516208 [Cokeromyces recurvatus]|uniref:uncharacterized protein n=1 Tax=Cokeromyces recurvatus TaxID=90255 RepID=UPI00221EB306|nr:uncharacterized protein BX663DRAFT_516208 [Cokeromyces recurvatus]KAI7901067.1 hypothetical protein BX663DRAFT_516208 [Cokeromyces recurvatus]